MSSGKKIIKISHLSSFDNRGGAAKAAHLIHKNLDKNRFESHFFVSEKKSNDKFVHQVKKKLIFRILPTKYKIENIIMKIFGREKGTDLFTSLFEYYDFGKEKIIKDSDLIALYWVADSFVSSKQILSFKKPLIWRLSDVAPFTGGCHYPSNCEKFIDGCKKCPRISNNTVFDLVEYNFKKKKKYLNKANITVIAPSLWIYKLAKNSNIFSQCKIEYIATGINTKIYFPQNKKQIRKKYGFSYSKKYVLFGASQISNDKRKGIELLYKCLKKYNNETFELIIFGEKNSELNIPCTNLGYISDEKYKSEVYSMCDVFVAPSIEENLANTVLESLACGTPAIAFNIGGMPDAIDHKINGYLARPFDTNDLWFGIKYILDNGNKLMRQQARMKVLENFDIRKQIKKYENLCNSILVR